MQMPDYWEPNLLVSGYDPCPRSVDLGAWMAFFYVYVDESGKLSANSDYTSLCGYVGHAQEWQRLSMEWNACRFKWQVPPIHMGQIMSPNPKDDWKKTRDQWGQDWEVKRDAMLAEFGHTIRVSSVVCVGAVVDANAYRKIQKDPTCILNDKDSNVFAFQSLLTTAIEKVETVDRQNAISVVVDDDPEHAMDYYRILETLRTNPLAPDKFAKFRKRIHGISFSKDESYPGLQAADMIAFESRNFMRNRMADPASTPTDLFLRLTHAGMHRPYIYTEATLYTIGRNTFQGVSADNHENKDGLGI